MIFQITGTKQNGKNRPITGGELIGMLEDADSNTDWVVRELD